jgi:hypothetical protein
MLLEAIISGTGVAPTHNANHRMVALSCTAGNGVSSLQSFEYVPYQAGHSQLILVTGVLGAGVVGAVVDTGVFDANNGIFYRQNGASGLQVVLRSSTSGSVVDTVVDQVNWNLDKLDGAGASRFTIDPTKNFILVIDAQFLAMGRVRIGFDLSGVIVWAHQFDNANVLDVPYMQTLTLPVKMLVTATGTGATKTAHFKCASVQSEGGFSDSLSYGLCTPEGTVTAGNGTPTHILSLRPALLWQTLPNRALLSLDSAEIIVTGNFPVLWQLRIGAVFSAAPTFAAVGARAASEYGTGGTFTAGSGTLIAAGYITSSAQNKGQRNQPLTQRYPLSLDAAGAHRADGTASLTVTGIGGTSACRATLNFRETR